MKVSKIAVIFVFSFLAVLPLRLDAAKGFYLSGGLGVSFPTMSGDFMDKANPQSGAAAELDLGYGIDKNWAIGLKLGDGDGSADENYLGNNALWDVSYIGIYGRYSFDKDQRFVPYVDLGVGSHIFEATSDDLVLTTDNAALGFNVDVGGNYYLGQKQRWYIGPELSYHYSYFNTKAEVNPDHSPDFKVDFRNNTSMILLMFKFGYQWRPAVVAAPAQAK